MKILAELDDGTIEVLAPKPFNLEVRLQELLEQHPELVLADLSDETDRSIWTIGWEVSTPAGSADLLMLDSTGRVWIVEAKLAANSEIKKQVVGQVLGYASCVADWGADDLDRVGTEYITRRVQTGHGSLIEYLADQLGDQADAQSLLNEASDKLAKGDLTALIVVDDAPPELRRLVEFVNANASFELLALKIQVFDNDDSKLFVPSVIGSVAASRQRGTRQVRERRQWDRQSFFEDLAANQPDAEAPMNELVDWVEAHPTIMPSWGSGSVLGSFIAWAPLDDSETDWISLFALNTNGRIAPTWRYRAVHMDQPWWDPMIGATAEISGVPQSHQRSKEWPAVRLQDPDLMARFKAIVEQTAKAARGAYRASRGDA